MGLRQRIKNRLRRTVKQVRTRLRGEDETVWVEAPPSASPPVPPTTTATAPEKSVLAQETTAMPIPENASPPVTVGTESPTPVGTEVPATAAEAQTPIAPENESAATETDALAAVPPNGESEDEVAPVEASDPLNETERAWVRELVIEQLQTIFDPEIPVNIYELGLIYGVVVAESGRVDVTMTLTSPNCPAAQSLPAEVETKSVGVPRATSSTVNIIWDPPWDPSMMSEAAQLELNML